MSVDLSTVETPDLIDEIERRSPLGFVFAAARPGKKAGDHPEIIEGVSGSPPMCDGLIARLLRIADRNWAVEQLENDR